MDDTKIADLKKQIEELRQELYSHALDKSTTSDEVLEVSKLLDKLINEYHAITKKKG